MNSRIIIPIALIAIGAGMYGISQEYLSVEQPSPVVEEAIVTPEPIAMTMVWVAKQDVAEKTQINSTMFELTSVPEKEAIAQGIDPTTPLNIDSSWLLSQTLYAGDWLSPSSFVTPDDPSYISFAVGENMVPYPLSVAGNTIVGGVVDNGALVDIIAITKQQHRLNPNEGASSFESVNINPVLVAIKVIKVEQNDELMEQGNNINLILELTRSQVAKLSIAKSIAVLEVHKSVGPEQAALLHANSGDVLPEYRAIVEYRAGAVSIR